MSHLFLNNKGDLLHVFEVQVIQRMKSVSSMLKAD